MAKEVDIATGGFASGIATRLNSRTINNTTGLPTGEFADAPKVVTKNMGGGGSGGSDSTAVVSEAVRERMRALSNLDEPLSDRQRRSVAPSGGGSGGNGLSTLLGGAGLLLALLVGAAAVFSSDSTSSSGS